MVRSSMQISHDPREIKDNSPVQKWKLTRFIPWRGIRTMNLAVG